MVVVDGIAPAVEIDEDGEKVEKEDEDEKEVFHDGDFTKMRRVPLV